MTVWEEVPKRVDEIAKGYSELFEVVNSHKATSSTRIDALESKLNAIQSSIDGLRGAIEATTGLHARHIREISSDMARLRGEVDPALMHKLIAVHKQDTVEAIARSEQKMGEAFRIAHEVSDSKVWQELDRLNGRIELRNDAN